MNILISIASLFFRLSGNIRNTFDTLKANWDSLSTQKKPLVLFFGLRPKTRPRVAESLLQYRCAFAFGKSSAIRQLAYINTYSPAFVCAPVHLGNPVIQPSIADFLRKKHIPLVLYRDIDEFLEDQRNIYQDEGVNFPGLILCGDIWNKKLQDWSECYLFVGVPTYFRRNLAQKHKTTYCAFMEGDTADMAGLTAFLTAYAPSQVIAWDSGTVLPDLTEFLKGKGLSLQQMTDDDLLQIIFIPCGVLDDFSDFHHSDKPLAVLWGGEKREEFHMALALPQFYLVKMANTLALHNLGRLKNLTFIFCNGWREDNVEAYARAGGIRVLHLYESVLSRIGYRKSFPTPLLYSLSEYAPDNLGLPSTAEFGDTAVDIASVKRAEEYLVLIKSLQAVDRPKADESAVDWSGDGFILAIWHEEEENSGMGGDDFLESIAKEEPGKKIVCLYLKRNQASSVHQRLSGRLKRRCVFLKHQEDIEPLIPLAEKIFVIGSLLGFEALLRGSKVVTYGCPFYAGWGLTTDRTAQYRTDRTLPELAHMFLFQETYRAPYSGEELTPEQTLAFLHLRDRSDFSYIFECLQDNFGLDERHLFLDMRIKYYHADPDLTAWLDRNLCPSVFGSALADLLAFKTGNKAFDALLNTLPTRSVFLLVKAFLTYCKTNLLYEMFADITRRFVAWFEERTFNDIDLLVFYTIYFEALTSNRFRDLGTLPSFRVPDTANSALHRQVCHVYSKIQLRVCRYDSFEAFFIALSPMPLDFYLDVIEELMTTPFAYREWSEERRLELRLRIFDKFLSETLGRNLPPLDADVILLVKCWLAEDIPAIDACMKKMAAGPSRPVWTEQTLALLGVMQRRLMQEMRYDQAESILKILESASNNHAHSARRRSLEYVRSFSFPGGGNSDQREREIQANLRRFENSRRTHATIDEIWQVSRHHAIEKHYLETSQIMIRTRQPDRPKGYIFMHHYGVHQTSALPVVVNSLAARGYATVPLSTGHVFLPSTRITGPHQYTHSIPGSNGQLALDWDIDFAAKKICALGINFYDRFFELLIVSLRRYEIDWEAPNVRRFFHRFLLLSDAHLRCCHEIYQFVKKGCLKAGVLFNFPYVMPQAAWLDYAVHVQDPKFRLIYYRTAHITRPKSGMGLEETTVSAVDMTLHKGCRVPFLPPREKFLAWYRRYRALPESDKDLEGVRDNLTSAVFEETPLYKRIKAEKERGRNIVCCYGRVIYDRALRKDGGPGHQDMIDWLLHSIEVAAGAPDMLLLIKPHPWEEDCSFSCTPIQQLRDVLPETLPDNVLYLPPEDIKTPQLKGVCNLAAMWLGTAAYELTALGVPVAVCSEAGRDETPFPIIYPDSREQYADLLRSGNAPSPGAEQQDQAAAYIRYLRLEEVAKPYPYSFLSTNNDFTAVPYYNREAVERYFEVGDPYIEQIVDQILEGLEQPKG